MSIRSGCLCLLLILVSAWTDDLQAGTFLAVSPTGTPLFGQEVFPISMAYYQKEIRAQLHALEQPVWSALTTGPWLPPGEISQPPPREAVPRFFSSADPGYLYMSLQR